MKSLLAPRSFVRAVFALALVWPLLTEFDARAASGTWTSAAGGSWTNTVNWSGGNIASLSGFTADFNTLNLTADATVTLDGNRTIGSMTFGDTTPSHNWTLSAGAVGTLTLAVASGIPAITINNQTNTITAVVAGTQGLNKTGGGTLILGGANTYTGGTTVSGGILQIGSGLAGSTATAPITNNSTLIFLKGDATAVTVASAVTGGGTMILSGTSFLQSGQFVLTGNNSFTGAVFLNRARMYDNAGGQVRFGSPSMINVTPGSGILAGAAVIYTNPVSLAGTGWQETTAPNFLGALRLSAGGTWAGAITLTANARINVHAQPGVVTGAISGPYELELSSTSGNSTLTLGSPANTTAATRIFNFGTSLIVTVTNANALSSGPLTMVGGTLRLNGFNLSFSNLSGSVSSSQIQNGHASTASTVTLGADNSSTSFAGGFNDGSSAALNVTKVGTGTLSLTGSSGHTGSTVISNGTLLVQGAAAALTGTGSVTVNSGTAFGDGGNVVGPINVLAGGALQASGLNGVILTCNSPLTFGTAGTDFTTNRINVNLGGKVAANGGLTVNGTNAINIVGSSPTVGVHDLITYSGTIGGSGFNGFVLGTMPAGTVATLQDSGTAVQLNVTVSGTEPKIWKGDIAAAWNPAAGNEWLGTLTSTAQPYFDFDSVTFDDAATNFTVNLTANVTPSSLIVTNTAFDYTFTGTGGIGGPVTLVKNGSGKLTINTTNSFTPPVAINAGTVAVARVANSGVNSPLGAGSSVDFNTGTLQVNEVSGSMNRDLNLIGNGTLKTDNALALSGAISGSGQLIKTGTGKVTLTGTAAPGSGTLISAGTVQIGDGSFFLGSLTGTIENHGTLTYFRTESTAEVAISGAISGDGTINFLGTGISLQGRYNPTGDNSTFTGPIFVNNARVQANSPARFGLASMITVTNNGGLYLPAVAEFANPMTLSGIGWLEGSPANYEAVRMANCVLSGPITLAGNTRVTALSATGFIINTISESGGSWKLELGQKEANQNNGFIILAATNTYSGGTDIRGAVVIGYTNSFLGSGPVTIDEGFVTTIITRLDVFGGVTLTNAFTLDSIAQNGARGVIAATNGLATLTGPITITANPANGGHFAADDVTLSTLRLTGPILSPSITPVAFVGTVEVGGGGTYTTFSHAGGVLRLVANNGLNSAAALTLGTTTASVFDLNGFNQSLTGLTKGASTSTTTNSSGTTSTLTLNIASAGTYAGTLSGNLGLTLGGAGTYTLSGFNNYSGATAVNAGTLLITGVNAGTGTVTVGSTAKLGGIGLIGGPVTIQNGGSLIPGTSIGTLTVTNTVTLAAGSTTSMEIHRNATPTADLLNGVTTLSYGGTLVVTNIGTNTLRSGDIYNLFDAAAFTTGFSAFNLPPLFPGLSWNTGNLTVDGTLNVTGAPIPPVFSPVSLAGNALTFAGTGGLSGARYVVLTGTNVTQPVITWTPIATNTFGGGGVFNFADTVSPAVTNRYYLIAVP